MSGAKTTKGTFLQLALSLVDSWAKKQLKPLDKKKDPFVTFFFSTVIEWMPKNCSFPLEILQKSRYNIDVRTRS